MQTVVWMAYSDYSHFSEQLSYKILYISRYGLKDMNLCKIQKLAEIFREKKRKTGPDLSP
jgi:hypothetical protein